MLCWEKWEIWHWYDTIFTPISCRKTRINLEDKKKLKMWQRLLPFKSFHQWKHKLLWGLIIYTIYSLNLFVFLQILAVHVSFLALASSSHWSEKEIQKHLYLAPLIEPALETSLSADHLYYCSKHIYTIIIIYKKLINHKKTHFFPDQNPNNLAKSLSSKTLIKSIYFSQSSPTNPTGDIPLNLIAKSRMPSNQLLLKVNSRVVHAMVA